MVDIEIFIGAVLERRRRARNWIFWQYVVCCIIMVSFGSEILAGLEQLFLYLSHAR